MAQGAKSGGRQKGTLNKNKQALAVMLAAKFPEYDPVIHMAEIANDPENEQSVRFNASKEVAKYRHAQLKAVDVQGDVATNITIRWGSPK